MACHYIEEHGISIRRACRIFNRTMRYNWLNQELSDNLEQVCTQAENWLYHYNHERPNMGNGGFTPIQKLNQAA